MVSKLKLEDAVATIYACLEIPYSKKVKTPLGTLLN